MKKVVVLVDGQNVFHTLRDMKLSEIDVDWKVLLDGLLSEEDELIRTYWFRPERVHDSFYTEYNIKKYLLEKKLFNKELAEYHNRLNELPDEKQEKLSAEYERIKKWVEGFKEKFDSTTYKYDKLSLSYEDIEMVKIGILKIDPFNKVVLGEKGVDVALAVKMIELSVNGDCHKIILMSGDYDYAQAIRYSKSKMMKLHIVKFHKGIPPKNRGMSHDLSVMGDKVIDVFESELRSTFKSNRARPRQEP